MTTINTTHRCSESECQYHGQPSAHSCRCHQGHYETLYETALDLLAIAQRWAALDGGSWHVERHAREKAELLSVTRAAIDKATGAA